MPMHSEDVYVEVSSRMSRGKLVECCPGKRQFEQREVPDREDPCAYA